LSQNNRAFRSNPNFLGGQDAEMAEIAASQNNRAFRSNPNKDERNPDVYEFAFLSSQNNRAFRSNPNDAWLYVITAGVASQNNRAFRSNPNPMSYIGEGDLKNLSQNNRAFRSNPNFSADKTPRWQKFQISVTK